MNKNIILIIIITLLVQLSVYAQTTTVTTYTPIQNNTYYNLYSAYNNDIVSVEEYLFGQNFIGDNFISRLNRIERKIFNKNYNTMNPVDRVNNILMSYKNQYYDNYLPRKSNDDSIAQRLLNRFIGQPTGFTPPVTNTPYNDFGYPMGINKFNNSNRGYSYNNTLPATAGAGVHILD